MQRAKDTFYVVLRDGIAAANAQRTVAVRGVLRPAVIVEENELQGAVAEAEVFRLRWTDVAIDRSGTVPLSRLRGEIRYSTTGTAELSGMDRGRVLAAMDWELRSALGGTVQSAPKLDYSKATPVPDGTRIFWSDPEFGEATTEGDRLARKALVDVWSVGGGSGL